MQVAIQFVRFAKEADRSFFHCACSMPAMRSADGSIAAGLPPSDANSSISLDVTGVTAIFAESR
jgi:hypothetical protein